MTYFKTWHVDYFDRRRVSRANEAYESFSAACSAAGLSTWLGLPAA